MQYRLYLTFLLHITIKVDLNQKCKQGDIKLGKKCSEIKIKEKLFHKI